MEAKGLVTELTFPYAQNARGSRGKRVQAVRLAAYYNYFSKKKKDEKIFCSYDFYNKF